VLMVAAAGRDEAVRAAVRTMGEEISFGVDTSGVHVMAGR